MSVRLRGCFSRFFSTSLRHFISSVRILRSASGPPGGVISLLEAAWLDLPSDERTVLGVFVVMRETTAELPPDDLITYATRTAAHGLACRNKNLQLGTGFKAAAPPGVPFADYVVTVERLNRRGTSAIGIPGNEPDDQEVHQRPAAFRDKHPGRQIHLFMIYRSIVGLRPPGDVISPGPTNIPHQDSVYGFEFDTFISQKTFSNPDILGHPFS